MIMYLAKTAKPISTIKYRTFIFLLVLVLTPFPGAQAMTVNIDQGDGDDGILRQIDKNIIYEKRTSEATLTIETPEYTRIKKFISSSEGDDKFLIEFTYPSRDRGTKYLKIGKNLWIYIPRADVVTRIRGHMLKQSMMGSDFSYEDMTDSGKLEDDYHVESMKSDTLNGKNVIVLELVAKSPDVGYQRRRIHVLKDSLVPVKELYMTKEGKVLKEVVLSNLKNFDDRIYPCTITIDDKLRKGSRTTITLEKLNFDADFPDDFFTVTNLRR